MNRATVTVASIERATYDVMKYKHNRYLLLTFRSEDGSRHWWEVPGWPEVKPGMTVTAFLTHALAPNRSNRVLGWKCHQTGELVADEFPVLHAATLLAICVTFGLLLLHLYSVSPQRSSLTSPIPGAVLLVMAAMALARLVRSAIIRRKLNAIQVTGALL
jgi:hypothetical protein